MDYLTDKFHTFPHIVHSAVVKKELREMFLHSFSADVADVANSGRLFQTQRK